MRRVLIASVALGALYAATAAAATPAAAPAAAAKAPAADTAWIEESNRYSQWLLELNARYQPEDAAGFGLEQYDTGVVDLKPGHDVKQEAELSALITKLEATRATVNDARVQQDLAILIKSATQARESSALNRRLMIPYFDVGRMVFGSFQDLLDPRLDPKRQANALIRLRRYTGSERGYEPLATLMQARVAEHLDDTTLAWPWVVDVQRSLDNGKRYIEGTRDLFQKSGVKGWQKEFAKLSRQLEAHDAWVRATVLPRARKTNRLPPEIYADNLKNYGVEASPQDLIQRALFTFMQTRDELDALARVVAAQRGYSSTNYRDVIRELKKNSIPRDKLLEVYRARLAQIEDIVRKEHLVTLPDRQAVIRLATETEDAASSGPYIDPPRLIGNTGEAAEFVLSIGSANAAAGAIADDFTYDAVSWTLTAHEARPGHELQFARMLEHGVSTARVVYAFNSANVEGWALYAEAVMKQYLPLEGQICSLQLRLARAARAFLDPMLNLGLVEPEAAKRLLMDEVVLSEPFAQKEVDRYTFRSPGQATSYFFGYSGLESLRAKTELALREKFTEQAYHDFIVNQGLLPIDLLEQAVMTQFVPAQQR